MTTTIGNLSKFLSQKQRMSAYLMELFFEANGIKEDKQVRTAIGLCTSL